MFISIAVTGAHIYSQVRFKVLCIGREKNKDTSKYEGLCTLFTFTPLGGDQSLLDRSQTDVSEEGEKNKTVTHVVITAC